MSLEFPLGITATIAVISTLAFLAKTGVGEAIRHKFRKDQARHAHELSTAENALLEEIRRLNTQLQAVQGTANAALIEGQRVAAEWRIKAVDEFWRQWVEETQKTPLQVQLWGSSDEESRVAIFLSDPKMRTLMKDYALPADRALASDMESTRPFVGDRPPALFRIYRTLVVRISHSMKQHASGEDTKPWYTDEVVLNLVRAALSDEEFERFAVMTNGHLVMLHKAIEREMLSDLRKIISGQTSTAEGLELGQAVYKVVQGLETAEHRSRQSE